MIFNICSFCTRELLIFFKWFCTHSRYASNWRVNVTRPSPPWQPERLASLRGAWLPLKDTPGKSLEERRVANWAMEKKLGCLGCTGDYTRRICGDYTKTICKDPYETTSIMESKTFLFVAQLMYQLCAGFQVVDRWMFLCGRFSAC